MKHTENDQEHPQTTTKKSVSDKQQTSKVHQVAPETQQKQADPKGQTKQVKRPPKMALTAAAEPTGNMEILSIHINNVQTSTYNATIGDTSIRTLFDSGATLSCISKRCFDRIRNKEPNQVIEANAGPPIIITLASSEELTNLR